MASDQLREAIERALPCTCADQSQTCPRGFSADVHKAVAPLLAAERASKRAEANAILDANSMEECARLRAALADELERREAAERDTARLDWLQAHELASVSPDHDKHGVLCGWDVEWTDDVGREWLYTGRTIREAIDAALAASDGEPKP